jgi:hypothetical protein
MTDDLKERLRIEAAAAIDWNGETMKQCDKIRQLCAKRDGSDLPRLMFEQLIEGLAECMTEAAARIEALEASNSAHAAVTARETTRCIMLEAQQAESDRAVRMQLDCNRHQIAALEAQLAEAQKALGSAREYVATDIDDGVPNQKKARRLIRLIDAALPKDPSTGSLT